MTTYTRTPEQVAEIDRFVEEVTAASPELRDWLNAQFDAGVSLTTVRDAIKRAMRKIAPVREVERPLDPGCVRTEAALNLNWGRENPELFVQSVKAFQDKTPITHWRHRIDLSRTGFMVLIAYRRDEPFNSVTDYVTHPTAYLTEIGMDL